MEALLLSIPSPDGKEIELGPFTIRAYGLLLAIGVLIAIWMTQREVRRRGCDPDVVGRVALWAVPAGIIGARVYHVLTDWHRFSDDLGEVVAIWNGGLGIYGAIGGGALGVWIGARRNGFPTLTLFDCVAPGLALAQAIGRWGNWFNQELFGGPTDLPWGLEISPENRPAGYEANETFHPTFLYESLWSLMVLVVVLQVSRRRWRVLPSGALFALYLGLYSLGRVWVEGLRIDPAHEIGPLRLNQVVAGLIVIACAVIVWRLWRRGGGPDLPPTAAPRRAR